jgi:hypothetical protein
MTDVNVAILMIRDRRSSGRQVLARCEPRCELWVVAVHSGLGQNTVAKAIFVLRGNCGSRSYKPVPVRCDTCLIDRWLEGLLRTENR